MAVQKNTSITLAFLTFSPPLSGLAFGFLTHDTSVCAARFVELAARLQNVGGLALGFAEDAVLTLNWLIYDYFRLAQYTLQFKNMSFNMQG